MTGFVQLVLTTYNGFLDSPCLSFHYPYEYYKNDRWGRNQYSNPLSEYYIEKDKC